MTERTVRLASYGVLFAVTAAVVLLMVRPVQYQAAPPPFEYHQDQVRVITPQVCPGDSITIQLVGRVHERAENEIVVTWSVETPSGVTIIRPKYLQLSAWPSGIVAEDNTFDFPYQTEPFVQVTVGLDGLSFAALEPGHYIYRHNGRLRDTQSGQITAPFEVIPC